MRIEQLKNRVERIERQHGGGLHGVYALVSQRGDSASLDEAIKRDIPAHVLAQAADVVTIYTGVPRAGDPDYLKVKGWWLEPRGSSSQSPR
jgi:hypothetical protein